MQTKRPQTGILFFLHRNRIKSKQIRLSGWIRHREPRFCGRASTKCVKSSSTRFAGWFSRRMFSLQTHCVCVCVCSGCHARSTGRRSVVILHGESVLGWDLAPEQSVGGTWTLAFDAGQHQQSAFKLLGFCQEKLFFYF